MAQPGERLGKNLPGHQQYPDGGGKRYKLINYAGVRDGVLHVETLKECCVKVDAERYCVQPGDILISCKGAQIKTCIVPESAGGALLTLNFIGVRLKKQVYSPAGLSYLWGRQVGTSIITLKNSGLKRMPVPVIPLPLQEKYTEEYHAVCRRVDEAVRQLRLEQRRQERELYQKMGLGPVLLREEE